MVILTLKKPPKDEWSKDYDEFTYECKLTDSIGTVTDTIQGLYNTRLRLRWISDSARALKETAEKDGSGTACSVFDVPLQKAKSLLQYGTSPLLHEYKELIAELQGCVRIVYPMHVSGTPLDYLKKMAVALEDETTTEKDRALLHRILSVMDDGASTAELLPTDTLCCLWWCGKCLERSKLFSDYLPKNEKTKIVVKITPVGAHPPVREPALDLTTQKEMMAYYYRKQEENKKLLEDDDISYANAGWADPNALKRQFQGTGNVRYN